MSPEQAQGKTLDQRSDLYSLGVTFYHMIAGEPPFRADSAIAMAMKHVNDMPPSIAVFRPDVPPELDKLVLKLMAKSRVDRYQNAAEMLKDLAKVRESMSVPSGAVPVSGLGASIATPKLKDEPSKSVVPLHKQLGLGGSGGFPVPSRGVLSSLVVLALIAGGAAGWFARPEDLLAETARPTTPRGMPGLWIAPRWSSIEKQAGPEEQFHHAQLIASGDDLEPAWLAVPGYFPGSRDWASRAYTQFARVLLRRHDAERLRVFASEIDQWEGAQAHERELAGICRAAADALNGEMAEMMEEFQKKADPKVLIDPALVELALEVTHEAQRVITRSPTPENKLTGNSLRKLQIELLSKLH
jgi:serine/threonine-protein kinase